jgi:steroid delta-isomerase-like uncharacterized protein
MDPAAMDELIETHIAAEIAGDSTAAVTVYTDDVEHDVVGWPTGAARGPAAAKGFYDALMAEFTNETMERTRSYYGEGFCVTEHQTTGTVPGVFLGVPGNGRRVTFRMLHVWEFRDGAISRENVWFDAGAIVAQLTEAERETVA